MGVSDGPSVMELELEAAVPAGALVVDVAVETVSVRFKADTSDTLSADV